MIFLLSFILLFLLSFLIVGFLLSGPVYKGKSSRHFNGKTFVNPGDTRAKGLPDVIKWMATRKRATWSYRDVTTPTLPASSVTEGIRITFVNHSTFLIQGCGINVLTDPVWSERVSPFSWAGPKRMSPPGIDFQHLPTIHYVLLSHNHYDHLDLATVTKISRLYDPHFITPLGVSQFLRKNNIHNARELDWWEEVRLSDDLLVHSVPAQHFSGRGTFDRDKTLWCGFVLNIAGAQVYFAGDTGYNERTFKSIGERFGRIRVALLPIGAYKPEWFMSPVHCSPGEAVKIHLDVNSEISLASHFGTFPLADESPDDPVTDLREALSTQGIPSGSFLALREGEWIDLK